MSIYSGMVEESKLNLNALEGRKEDLEEERWSKEREAGNLRGRVIRCDEIIKDRENRKKDIESSEEYLKKNKRKSIIFGAIALASLAAEFFVPNGSLALGAVKAGLVIFGYTNGTIAIRNFGRFDKRKKLVKSNPLSTLEKDLEYNKNNKRIFEERIMILERECSEIREQVSEIGDDIYACANDLEYAEELRKLARQALEEILMDKNEDEINFMLSVWYPEPEEEIETHSIEPVFTEPRVLEKKK